MYSIHVFIKYLTNQVLSYVFLLDGDFYFGDHKNIIQAELN